MATRVGKRGVDVWDRAFDHTEKNYYSSPDASSGLINKLNSNCDKRKSLSEIYPLTYEEYKHYKVIVANGKETFSNNTPNEYAKKWVLANIVFEGNDGKYKYNEEKIREYFELDEVDIKAMKENSDKYYITAEYLFCWIVRANSPNRRYVKRLEDYFSSSKKYLSDDEKTVYFFGTTAEAANYVVYESSLNPLYIANSQENIVGDLVTQSENSPIKMVKSIGDPNLMSFTGDKNNLSNVINARNATCNNSYGINIFRLYNICDDCGDPPGEEEPCDEKTDPSCKPKPVIPDIPEPEGSTTGCGDNYNACTQDNAKYNGICSSSSKIEVTSTYCIDDSFPGYSAKYNKDNVDGEEKSNVYYKVECEEVATIKNGPRKNTYVLNNAGSYNIYLGYTLDYKRECKKYYKTKKSDGTFGWTDKDSEDIFLKKKITSLNNGTYIQKNGNLLAKVSYDEADIGQNSSCTYHSGRNYCSCPWYYNYEPPYLSYSNPHCPWDCSAEYDEPYYTCTFNNYYSAEDYDSAPECKDTKSCIANHIINYGGTGSVMTLKTNYQSILENYAALKELLDDDDYKTVSGGESLPSDAYTDNKVIDHAKQAYKDALGKPNYKNENDITNAASFKYYDYLVTSVEKKDVVLSPVYCYEDVKVEKYCLLDNGQRKDQGEEILENARKFTCGSEFEEVNDSVLASGKKETVIRYELPSSWRSKFPNKAGRFIFEDKNKSDCKTANNGNECIETKNGYTVEPAGEKLIYHLNKIVSTSGSEIAFENNISVKGLGMCGQLEFNLDCSNRVKASSVCDPEGKNYNPEECTCKEYCGGDLICLSKHCPDECPECDDIEGICGSGMCYETKCAGEGEECRKSKCCKEWCGDKYRGDSTKLNTCLADECCAGQCNGNSLCSESCCHEICGTDINCINKYCPDPCFEEGCADYVYRTIDMSNPFPGRIPGKNWENKVVYITNRGNEVGPYYDETNGWNDKVFEYQVKLSAAAIKEIKENADLKNLYTNGKHADGTDVSDTGEGKCYRSAFLHDEDNGLVKYIKDKNNFIGNESWCNNK